MKHTAIAGIGITFVFALASLQMAAQTQPSSNTQTSTTGPSLGEYARQVRKGPDGKPKPKVFDNDNLPQNEKLSVVGTATPEAGPGTRAEESTNAATKPDAAAANDPNKNKDQAAREAEMKQWADKISAQQQAIDLLTRELDVLQREYQVRAAAMYADAGNRLRNSGDWDKQDAQYKQQIADKQKALDDAKQKLDDLQEEARKAGVPSSVREP